MARGSHHAACLSPVLSSPAPQVGGVTWQPSAHKQREKHTEARGALAPLRPECGPWKGGLSPFCSRGRCPEALGDQPSPCRRSIVSTCESGGAEEGDLLNMPSSSLFPAEAAVEKVSALAQPASAQQVQEVSPAPGHACSPGSSHNSGSRPFSGPQPPSHPLPPRPTEPDSHTVTQSCLYYGHKSSKTVKAKEGEGIRSRRQAHSPIPWSLSQKNMGPGDGGCAS